MAFEQRQNSANVFSPRTAGEHDYTGEANIDGEIYEAKIGAVRAGTGKNGYYSMRNVTFTGRDVPYEFTGTLFDRSLDREGNMRQDLKPNTPRYRGKVKANIGDGMPLEKDVTAWEKTTKNGQIFLSMKIEDPRDTSSQAANNNGNESGSVSQHDENPY